MFYRFRPPRAIDTKDVSTELGMAKLPNIATTAWGIR